LQQKEPDPGDIPALSRMLLLALERARSRLAIAIAAETKVTPPARWQYYLETAEEMRRCVKELRWELRNGLAEEGKWFQALEELHRLPPAEQRPRSREAQQLCGRVREILAALFLMGD